MRRFALLFVLVLAFGPFVFAGETAPMLEGEAFSKKLVGHPADGEKLIEFIRPTETPQNWTRLIAYRFQQIAVLENDPEKYAQATGQLIMRANPRAHIQIEKDDKSGQAIIEYLTWPPDESSMEFNVVRFWRVTDGKGVASLHYKYRFVPPRATPGNPANTEEVNRKAKEFHERRLAWGRAAAEADTREVETVLGLP